MKRLVLTIVLAVAVASVGFSQQGVRIGATDEISYLDPQSYIIGGVTISGTEYLDNDVLITISRLVVGSRIEVPSEATSNVVKNLMDQGLFDDVQLYADRI